jgi:hypothetical protein
MMIVLAAILDAVWWVPAHQHQHRHRHPQAAQVQPAVSRCRH